jgi:hypothetical protein
LFALVSGRFQPAPNYEVPGSRLNPRDKIFLSEYLGTYVLKKDGVHETFVCLIMFQDINRVVAPPVTLKGRGTGRTQNLMIILKILRKSNIKSVKSNTEIPIRREIDSEVVWKWF